MNNSIFTIPEFKNEPCLDYLEGSAEREALMQKLKELKGGCLEIPIVINGEEIKTGRTVECILPHEKQTSIGFYHEASEYEVKLAIESAMDAKIKWESMHWQHRVAIFLKAAHLASTSWRATLNAATMLSQSKTYIQAEIDSACELIDFFNANAYWLSKIYEQQPINTREAMNRIEYRPLEGFVFAVSPFNFTAIGANLCGAPAMAGNTIVWKPSSTAVYSSYLVYKLLQEAGLPKGVINFIPGNASMISKIVLSNSNLSGVHFTGSTEVFNYMWKTVGENVANYKDYPRIVGETGGKNFVLAHNSANIRHLVMCLIRGAFEYQGQKCSATSRVYIPESIWLEVKQLLLEEVSKIKIGNVEEFDNLLGAVIDKSAFTKIKGYIDYAKEADNAEILFGGKCEDEIGYFIEPTIIQTTDINFKLLVDEIFGPVLTIYVYRDLEFNAIMHHCSCSSKYALTGSIFANDREIILEAEKALMYSAGNFYINDKTTGAAVGNSPFGGARASGTNDKAGSLTNMLRWVSLRSIKENYVQMEEFGYKGMKSEK